MKLDKIKDLLKNKNELVPTVLLLFSVLCGILILVKVTGFFVASARAKSVVERAVEQSVNDPKNVEKQLASSAAITDELKKNNLFAPPVARQHPVQEVSGIFGDQVLIQDKWYSVGEMVKDAKIVAIGATSVTIAWDGKEKSFLPIEAKIAEASGGQKGRTTPNQKDGGESDKKDENGEKRPEVTVRVEGGGPLFGGRGGAGEGFMAMRERFENMSEEERQAFRERMRERFARERGGDFVRRGGPGGRGPGGR
ncbi:MAG: hypothetical protein JXA81_14625 [Sedimentisphaerales bacterium]|nr:hypothetical protein [Sedimentisphaerales bacterium]